MSLKGISKRGREYINFLKSGLERGLSGKAILKEIKDTTGKAYRDQDFYSDMRVLSGAKEDWGTMRKVAKDKVISERLYKSSSKDLLSNYKTVVRVEGTDLWKDQKATRYVTVSHKDVLTPRQLEDKAFMALIEAGSRFDIDRAFPVEGYKNY